MQKYDIKPRNVKSKKMSGPAKETHIQKNSQLFNFCWLRRHCRHDSDMSAIVPVVCPSSGMDVMLLFLLLLLKLLILMTLKPFVLFQFVKWELFFSSWRRRRHCHYHILLLPNLFSPFDMLFSFFCKQFHPVTVSLNVRIISTLLSLFWRQSFLHWHLLSNFGWKKAWPACLIFLCGTFNK